jgi:signal transduction histidine kinase
MTQARRRLLAAGAIALALLVALPGAVHDWDAVRLLLLDVAVGWSLIVSGVICWYRRPSTPIGALVAAAGYAWFIPDLGWSAGGAWDWLAELTLYVHRAPLIHAVLVFPGRELRWPLDGGTVAAGYATALIAPLGTNDMLITGVAALVAVAAVNGARRSAGPRRRARFAMLPLAVGLAAALGGPAVARVLFPGAQFSDPMLAVYQLTLAAVGIGVAALTVRGGWERAAVTDLVLGLTKAPSQAVRDGLARALGDPTLQVAYPDGSGGYLDETGRRLELPSRTASRATTVVELEDQVVAVLLHDPAVLGDPGLGESIATAGRLAGSSARLRAQVRAQIEEVDASSRRLLEVADQERTRLQRRLREGPADTLVELAAELETLFADADRADDRSLAEALRRARSRLAGALDDLRDLARGLQPGLLTTAGLAGALQLLARDLSLDASVTVSAEGLDEELAAAAYFICAEGLTNTAKHARATRSSVTIERRDGRLRIAVIDDGVGGADPKRGSGIRGLTERVEMLGGTLSLESPAGRGTRLVVELPAA